MPSTRLDQMPTDTFASYAKALFLEALIIELGKFIMRSGCDKVHPLTGATEEGGTFKATSEKTFQERLAWNAFQWLD